VERASQNDVKQEFTIKLFHTTMA